MLTTQVLVLNRYYQPITLTTVRRAFSLLYQGHAKAITPQYKTFDFDSWAALSAEVHDADVIHTVSSAIRIPRVIILQIFDRFPAMHIRFSRQNIYLRDRLTCQYCGKVFPRQALNLDHVVPRTQGGTSTWTNVVCSCIRCNLAKGGRTPEEAGMTLLREPVRPNWSPFTKKPGGALRYEAWRPFLNLADASYWHSELHES